MAMNYNGIKASECRGGEDMHFSKSFIAGLAKSAGLFPVNKGKEQSSVYNGIQKDYQALKGDWINVGNDVKKGIEHCCREKCR